jgi:hypothetical protein
VRIGTIAGFALALAALTGCGNDESERDAARELAEQMWFDDETYHDARDLGNHVWLLVYRRPEPGTCIRDTSSGRHSAPCPKGYIPESVSYRCHTVTDPLDDVDFVIEEVGCPDDLIGPDERVGPDGEFVVPDDPKRRYETPSG